ncbi:MAG: hypothetical protein ACRDTA_18670 [Pseudonocardiaceae bacterium]
MTENDDPSPRDIDRLAASIGLKLAASTVEGWFRTHSVVPAWEKFEVLIKALAAEQDEDWRALHGAALTADRERKKEERRRKDLADPTALAPSGSLDSDGEPAPQRLALDSASAAVPAKGRFWAPSRKLGAAVVLVVLPAVLILLFLFRPTPGGGPASSAPSSGETPAAQPPVRYCSHVITEPAGVYPAPDSSIKQIKFKLLHDRVVLLNHPHPPSGWVAVSTPRDNPGYNWMQANALATPAPCPTPLPRRS